MGDPSSTPEPPIGAVKQLSAAMEHMRFAVTLPEQDPDTYGIPGFIQPVRKPRTDAANNPQKRSDPFQFGSRFLEEGNDIFEHNAWDHVETDEAYGKFAEEQYARQRESPVDEAVKSECSPIGSLL
jgi:tRNAThr (cytosine32-N3)-methyltransferase